MPDRDAINKFVEEHAVDNATAVVLPEGAVLQNELKIKDLPTNLQGNPVNNPGPRAGTLRVDSLPDSAVTSQRRRESKRSRSTTKQSSSEATADDRDSDSQNDSRSRKRTKQVQHICDKLLCSVLCVLVV